MKVRASLVLTHVGPYSLEEATQDYINKYSEQFDLPGMVSVSNEIIDCLQYLYMQLVACIFGYIWTLVIFCH